MNSVHTSRPYNSAPASAPRLSPIPARLVDCALDKASPRWLTRTGVTQEFQLTLQRHAFLDQSSICICDSFHAAQRYACEIMQTTTFAKSRAFVIHEMMPRYQQDYIISCLDENHTFHINASVALFTSAIYYPVLLKRLPWLRHHYQHIKPSQPDTSSVTNLPLTAEPTVSCICLRTGSGGRWILMDHEEATTISPHATPGDAIIGRLLNHTIQISGNRLAPYLAMMFDVPRAWKTDPDLVTKSLLIFDKDVCATGCTQPGIPRRLIWSDVFGIIYDS